MKEILSLRSLLITACKREGFWFCFNQCILKPHVVLKKAGVHSSKQFYSYKKKTKQDTGTEMITSSHHNYSRK